MVLPEARDRPSDVPPSQEEVRAFVEWLKENRVASTHGHEGFAQGTALQAFTFRLDDVAAADKTWAVRLGVTQDAPSGQALSISNRNEIDRISGEFDAENGADITRLPKKEIPGRTFRRMNEAMFQEIFAAFQAAQLEGITVNTIKKWGARR